MMEINNYILFLVADESVKISKRAPDRKMFGHFYFLQLLFVVMTLSNDKKFKNVQNWKL